MDGLTNSPSAGLSRFSGHRRVFRLKNFLAVIYLQKRHDGKTITMEEVLWLTKLGSRIDFSLTHITARDELRHSLLQFFTVLVVVREVVRLDL